MNAPSVTVTNGSYYYNKKQILGDVNLHLAAAQWTALLGPSGSGKSTLFRLIAGLQTEEASFSGKITASNHLPVHPQIAYMAQTDSLLPWLNILENTCLGYHLRGEEPDRRKACTLLSKAGLSDVIDAFPHELSGGMRQRAAVIRTLFENKPIILMDEPFSALDAITRYQLQALAHQTLRGKTVLFITHDPVEAVRLADHIYLCHGQPASLNYLSTVEGAAPRDLTEPTLIQLQQTLLQRLAGSEAA